ncbi:PIN domain-containing protein [Planktothrix agardhii]|uniref:PIN domain nucleic acid-binding protein n=1 Tax=Planktothrix agardhii TaxID=1160 RepID=A0AAD1Q6A7_PLAAG|nr:hypothetical protein NIES204_00080 [Planktothrix agardhii NIES-204]CAD5909695.1 Putative PIN domain nucleic acid-binding protein [Planktothrix agardhii]CAD5955060.1 Putative PIN domain nucleic acid-binding protein [Planktothrix agardhii]CAD5968921.1 Putative PIN domain nucleic acid-binding protein [Planktothrix agardhii]CAD5977480.1 Putative PIN domain nucleic acid-binding protein [Planktothrix agardhii]
MLHSCVLLKFLLIIAIDTNIIVRFITRDDELQYQQSLELFKNKNIFIPDTVILETEWVLRFAYKFKPLEIYTFYAAFLR